MAPWLAGAVAPLARKFAIAATHRALLRPFARRGRCLTSCAACGGCILAGALAIVVATGALVAMVSSGSGIPGELCPQGAATTANVASTANAGTGDGTSPANAAATARLCAQWASVGARP